MFATCYRLGGIVLLIAGIETITARPMAAQTHGGAGQAGVRASQSYTGPHIGGFPGGSSSPSPYEGYYLGGYDRQGQYPHANTFSEDYYSRGLDTPLDLDLRHARAQEPLPDWHMMLLNYQHTALITVKAPQDAHVWFDQAPMASTGSVRKFRSPELQTGRRYVYDVRARWTVNGKAVSHTKQVVISAGGNAEVDFSDSAKHPGRGQISENR